MTELHPDVAIYMKKLRKFFSEDTNVFKQIFGENDLEDCMKLCQTYSMENIKTVGQPQLTKQQFREIKRILDKANLTAAYHHEVDTDKMFLDVFPGQPPICLN
jgi:alcohol dehydrogenase class IV